MLRFAGFELDYGRAELRGPGGQAIRVRPKTLTTLHLLATNPRKVFGKQELMDAVWLNVHVGEHNLFQCISEIRVALGDDRHELVKLIPGQGYVLDAEVAEVIREPDLPPPDHGPAAGMPVPPLPEPDRGWFATLRRPMVLTLMVAAFGVGLAVAAPLLAPRLFGPTLQAVAMTPLVTNASNPAAVAMAANVTARLTDGLSRVANLRVLPSPKHSAGTAQTATALPANADLVVEGSLVQGASEWTVQIRLVDAKSGDVRWSGSTSAPAEHLDLTLQQSRLAAGVGHPLSVRINALTHTQLPSPESKFVIEQATAFINYASRERFETAVAMLEKALVERPRDVDIEAALAAHLLRGVQMAWYGETAAAQVERRAQTMLEQALRTEPNYLPVLVGYCRLLMTTSQFAETLGACGKALDLDPWDGMVLFQIGISQLQLGRFEDALETFRQADAFDTPQVSRWTWLLGAGIAEVLLDRSEAAVAWLERSIAITPGSGRGYFTLAAAYQRLGRHAEAKAAVAKGLETRPGSNAQNVNLPTKNSSARFLAGVDEVTRFAIEAGLPEN